MKRLFYLAIAAIAILIVACGEDATATPTRAPTATPTTAAAAPTPTPTSGPVQPVGTLTAAVPTFAAEVLAPGVQDNANARYWGPIYDFFVGVDEDGLQSNALGALKDWQMSPDGKVWTLTLRSGMRWHDGEEVTAVDGKFSMERYAKPDATCAMCGVVGANLDFAETVDKYVFKVHFKKADQFLDKALMPLQGDLPILPKHHWEKVGDREGVNRDNAIGSGPFRFVERRIGDFIEYESNTDYWNPDRTPTYKTLRQILIPEESSRLALVKVGDADMALMTEQLISEIKAAGLRIMGAQDTWITFLGFAQSWDPNFATNDIRVRKAMALAIDRKALVETVFPGGAAKPMDFVVSPLQEGFIPDLEPFPYDPVEARRLLKESGHEGLEVVMFLYSFANALETPLVHKTAAAFLTEAGFKPKLITRDFVTFAPDLFAGTMQGPAQLGQWNWLSSSTLTNNLRVLMVSHDAGGSVSVFADRELIDGLFAEYNATLDETQRIEVAKRINRAMHDSFAYIPIAFKNEIWVVSPKIESYRPPKGTGIHTMFETVTLVPGAA